MLNTIDNADLEHVTGGFDSIRASQKGKEWGLKGATHDAVALGTLSATIKGARVQGAVLGTYVGGEVGYAAGFGLGYGKSAWDQAHGR